MALGAAFWDLPTPWVWKRPQKEELPSGLGVRGLAVSGLVSCVAPRCLRVFFVLCLSSWVFFGWIQCRASWLLDPVPSVLNGNLLISSWRLIGSWTAAVGAVSVGAVAP
jgi:hypothetical protein